MNNLKSKKKYLLNKGLIYCILFVFAFTLNGCTFCKDDDRTVLEEQQAFDEFCNEEFTDTLSEDSFSINFMLKNPDKYGIDSSTVKIQDISEDFDKKSVDENKKVLKSLKEFDCDKLTDQQKITYNTLKIFLDNQIEFSKFPDIYNAFSPSKGIISSVPNNYVEYIIESKQDAENYIELVKGFKDYVDNALEYTRKQSEEGLFMTDYAADKVIEKCNKFLESKDNPFITSFNKKIDKLNITGQEKEDLKASNKRAVLEYVNSAYSDVINTLEDLKGTGVNDKGICKFKDGKDYYENLVKVSTGTDKSMNQIIQGVEKNLNECVNIISKSSVNTSAVEEDFNNEYKDNSEPENIINYLKDNLNKYYPQIEDGNYYVDYQDKSLEVDGIIAYYMTSRIDDWKENHIKINESETKGNLELLYTTLAHESYPGHLYQHIYFCQTNPNPIRFLTENLGYAEGWAECAADSSLEFLGLPDETLKYVKAVEFTNSLLYTRMDIGINYEGWDKKDLQGFLEKYNIKDQNFIDNYYDAIVADPGIMLPYTIGKIEMLNLKKKAEDELGDKFDIKEYNKVILDTGNVPFKVLESEVEKYIDKNA